MFPVNDFELDDYENHRASRRGEAHLPWYLSLYVYRAYLHRIPELAQKAMHRLLPAGEGGPDIGWELNVAALRQMQGLVNGWKLPMTVALLPHTKGFETQRKLFARVKDVCAAERLDCLDLLEPLRAHGVRDGALVLNAIDSHPNLEYHQIIAAELEARLAPRLPAPLATPVTSPTGPAFSPTVGRQCGSRRAISEAAMTTTALMPSDRKFGWTFTALFVLIGALSHPWALLAAAVLAVITLTRAHWLAPAKRAWMKFGELLNHMVSPIVMGVIFFAVFTPVALVMRAIGRDAMARAYEPAAPTYWKRREPAGPGRRQLQEPFLGERPMDLVMQMWRFLGARAQVLAAADHPGHAC